MCKGCVLDSAGTGEWALLTVLVFRGANSLKNLTSSPRYGRRQRDVREDPGDRCLTSKALHRP